MDRTRTTAADDNDDQEGGAMTGNRAVAYIEPGKVEIQDIPYPKLELQDGPGVNPANIGRKCEHGVILKVVSTNICGSDQHMVRGRTTAPVGLILGHEITGEVMEKGPDVENLAVGDLVSVPFNVSCGRCRNCRERNPGCVLMSTPSPPAGRMATLTWAAGLAVRPNT
ncbi:MAG TPA: alcohol dehydrogenase catalytic domain-containing protein [Pseudonocardiaceae bacterium]|nr:alcohol dehydrogenase catalytic domain-containing protein [Pseudonocardiaceae bacterium]